MDLLEPGIRSLLAHECPGVEVMRDYNYYSMRHSFVLFKGGQRIVLSSDAIHKCVERDAYGALYDYIVQQARLLGDEMSDLYALADEAKVASRGHGE